MQTLLVLLIVCHFIFENVNTSSNVVIYPNGTISTYSLTFNSTATYPTSKSFGVEIITSPDSIARCIAWLFYSYPSPNKAEIIENFWFYEANKPLTISQPNLNRTTRLYIRDGHAEGRNNRRIIWFTDLPTNINPKWDLLCSVTPVLMSSK